MVGEGNYDVVALLTAEAESAEYIELSASLPLVDLESAIRARIAYIKALHLSFTVLVPYWDAEGGEDFLGLGGQGVGGGEAMAVDVDGDVLKRLEDADDALDADTGGPLEVPGDGQGGHHHGQMRLDGLTDLVQGGAGPQGRACSSRRNAPRATARDTRKPPHRHPSSVRA